MSHLITSPENLHVLQINKTLGFVELAWEWDFDSLFAPFYFEIVRSMSGISSLLTTEVFEQHQDLYVFQDVLSNQAAKQFFEQGKSIEYKIRVANITIES